MELKVKRTSKHAQLPTKKRPTDAGWDFYAAHLNPWVDDNGCRVEGHTGVSVEIPAGWYLQLFCRSGLARQGWVISGGVIDHGYTGEVIALLSNPDPAAYQQLERGDRIAQGVLLPVPKVTVVEVDELSASERGEKGFGSSGK